MVWDNFLTQLDDQNYQTKKSFGNVYFEDKSEKLPEPD